MPRKKIPPDLRSLARGHTELSIKVLAGIAQNGQTDGARVAAAVALLDRGWGRPAQPQAGEDGGELIINIRKIVDADEDSSISDPSYAIANDATGKLEN